MKKKVLSIVLATLMASMFFACGTATSSETGEVINSTVSGGAKTDKVEDSANKQIDVTSENENPSKDQSVVDSTKEDTSKTVAKKTDNTDNTDATVTTNNSTAPSASASSNTSSQSQPTAGQNTSTAPANSNSGAEPIMESGQASNESIPYRSTIGDDRSGDCNKDEAAEASQLFADDARGDLLNNRYFGGAGLLEE